MRNAHRRPCLPTATGGTPATGGSLSKPFTSTGHHHRESAKPEIKVDATSIATNVDAIGAGEGDVGLIATVSDPSLIGIYPLLDDVESHTDVSELPTLDAWARKRLTRGAAPIVIPSVDYDPALEPVLGSFIPGDIMRVRGGYGLASIDGSFRVTEIGVSVDDNGGEAGKLSFAGLESFT
jgi:hypothetical protein